MGRWEQLNEQDEEGWRPLHLAVIHARTDALLELLEAGADPNLPRGNNYTKLITYASDAYLPYGCTPLHLATSNENREVARILLDANANPNCYDKMGYTPLHLAAKSGNTEIAALLLNSGADLSLHTKPEPSDLEMPVDALYLAAYSRHSQMASLLIEHGACHDVFTATMLNDAERLLSIVRETPSCVESVFNGWQPMHYAAFANAETAAEVLVAHGADVNAVEEDGADGYTPLHLALSEEHIEFMQWLLNHGADPDAGDDGGDSALYYAVLWDCLYGVKILLENGANPSFGSDQKPLLDLALSQQKPNTYAIVGLLRDAGCMEELDKEAGDDLEDGVEQDKDYSTLPAYKELRAQHAREGGDPTDMDELVGVLLSGNDARYQELTRGIGAESQCQYSRVPQYGMTGRLWGCITVIIGLAVFFISLSLGESLGTVAAFAAGLIVFIGVIAFIKNTSQEE